MKRKILSLSLAIVFVFAMAIPVSAAEYVLSFYYNGELYNNVSNVLDEDISSKAIGDLKEAIKNKCLKDSTGNTVELQVTNPILIYDNKLLSNDNHTLPACGVKSGSTIYMYSASDVVIVRFQGKDYAVNMYGSFTVAADLKTAIKNELNTNLSVDDMILYDYSGNQIADSNSVIAGSTLYLYSKTSGTIQGISPNYNDYKHPVTATYQAGMSAPATYYVDITWGSMEFTYTAPDSTWNPATHKEETGNGNGTWTCNDGANQIKVENHSNADVKVKFEFQASDNGSVLGQFTANASDTANNTATYLTDGAIVLDSAMKGDDGSPKPYDAPATVVASLELEGSLLDSIENDTAVQVGTVTVVIE